VRILLLVGLAVCLVAIAVSARPSLDEARAVPQKNCGTLKVGPAAGRRGAVGGAGCLLRAFQQHCQPATYTLSVFGVDTVATDTFRLTRSGALCRIGVTVSFEVVPQPPRLHQGRCKTLKRQNGLVIASGCTGSGVPKTITLNPPTSAP
jgi:hypothetical protein